MLLYLFVVIFVCVPSDAQEVSAQTCNIPTHHYQELGCFPNYSPTNRICPISYSCPNLETRSPDKCYYKGKTIEVGQNVEEVVYNEHCIAGCYCAKFDNETAFLNCANFQCAPLSFELGPQCYLAAEHRTCCPHQAFCAEFDNLANCSVNGIVYYEGQRFIPPLLNQFHCICMRNFMGQYIQPFCMPINCAIEITHSKELANKCAPVFARSVCPVYWQCEQTTDIIETNRNGNTNSAMCVYGKRKLNVGDKVVTRTGLSCECLIPPLLTCYQ